MRPGTDRQYAAFNLSSPAAASLPGKSGSSRPQASPRSQYECPLPQKPVPHPQQHYSRTIRTGNPLPTPKSSTPQHPQDPYQATTKEPAWTPPTHMPCPTNTSPTSHPETARTWSKQTTPSPLDGTNWIPVRPPMGPAQTHQPYVKQPHACIPPPPPPHHPQCNYTAPHPTTSAEPIAHPKHPCKGRYEAGEDYAIVPPQMIQSHSIQRSKMRSTISTMRVPEHQFFPTSRDEPTFPRLTTPSTSATYSANVPHPPPLKYIGRPTNYPPNRASNEEYPTTTKQIDITQPTGLMFPVPYTKHLRRETAEHRHRTRTPPPQPYARRNNAPQSARPSTRNYLMRRSGYTEVERAQGRTHYPRHTSHRGRTRTPTAGPKRPRYDSRDSASYSPPPRRRRRAYRPPSDSSRSRSPSSFERGFVTSGRNTRSQWADLLPYYKKRHDIPRV